MKHKVAWLLSGIGIIVLGALLCLVGTVAARHGDVLERAAALAETGDTAEALSALQAAEAQYEKAFWGIPQGPLLNALSCLGLSQRGDIRLRAAVAQYKDVQGITQDPYRLFTARANGARAMTQFFLVQGFLGEEQRDQAGLKQGLMRAVKLLQEALDALYTDAVRVSSAAERSLVLLLEALTRFERRPDVEADERRRLAQFFRDTEFESDVAPLGEILRSTDSQALSRAESNMREFLLNQSPDSALRENERDPSGSRSGKGSADSGGEGGTH